MRLLADIGGTNARFALAAPDGTLRHRQVLKVRSFPTFEDAIGTYAATIPEKPVAAAMSVAGPVVGGRVDMTNANWLISAEAVQSVCSDIPVRIVNDLVAVALAVPVMTAQDFEIYHAGRPPEEPAPILSINIGTGFGAAVSVPRESGWYALASEAGHITLATADSLERELLGDGKTVEQIFSGPGLKRLRERFAAAGIPDRRLRTIYSKVLGRLAGDLALSVGAWGGIAFCGGVLSAFDDVIDRSAFLSAIGDRSGLAKRLQCVPIRRIVRDDPAFLGLMQLDLPEAN